MTNAPALLALATVTAGAYMLAQSAGQGSGAGLITTDDTSEGSIMDFAGLAGQIADAATPAPQGNPDTISPEGLAALQKREGFSATPYADHKGYSIGFGHLIKPGENLQTVTVAQALDLLQADVTWAVQAVRDCITAPIDQSQFDALVSFCYNVGAGAFKRSTLVRRINASDPGAGQEFARWVYASGKVHPGLVARRNGERKQFEENQA